MYVERLPADLHDPRTRPYRSSVEILIELFRALTTCNDCQSMANGADGLTCSPRLGPCQDWLTLQCLNKFLNCYILICNIFILWL